MNILCCGFFPALQRTLEYSAFRAGDVNRAHQLSVTASGKATNNARVLHALGAHPTLLSFLGGHNGTRVRELLEAEGLVGRWVESATETRICQTLLSDADPTCTELVEDTPPLQPGEWKNFIQAFCDAAKQADPIICSGNLPPHAPPDIYAELLSKTDGRNVVLDCYGPPLLATLEHRPALVKINADELRRTFSSDAPLIDLAREAIALGARNIGITQGKDQALLVTPDGVCRFSIPTVQSINPIGSGDAVTAGTTFSLADGRPVLEAFVFGLACGISNALHPLPGHIDPHQLSDIASRISTQTNET